MTYVTGGAGEKVIVTYMCFIEAWDLMFQQFEASRDRKLRKAQVPPVTK